MDILLNNKELPKYISSLNNRIDYIAIVTTPWHLIGLEYTIKKYVSKPKNGFILIEKHQVSGFCLNETQVRKRLGEDVLCLKYQYDNDNILDIIRGMLATVRNKSSKKIMKIISPNKPWIRFALNLQGIMTCKFEFYVYDEGLGACFKKDIAYYTGIEKLHFIFNRFIENKLLSKYKVVDNSLLIRDGEQISLNRVVLDEYRNKINKMCVLSKEIDTSQKYVLINTQTYYDNGEMDDDEEIKVLLQIIKLLKEKNIKVYLKPHPRDKTYYRYYNLGADIIPANVSQEEYLSSVNNKPIFVIGFTTTTLMTLSLFYDIKTISLVDCINYNSLKGDAKRDFKVFKKLFSELVYIPLNIDDFKNVLEIYVKK